jgi:hypothetical protein
MPSTMTTKALPLRVARIAWSLVGASLLALAPGPRAHAQLVPASQCNPPPCGCNDMKMLERALKASNDSLAAWESVLAQFSTPNPPKTMEEARAAFDAVNPADAFLLAQMQTQCPTFNGGKVGGVDSEGNTMYLPCFCQAFCKDIVEATGAHEQQHHKNMVDLALHQITVVLGGALMGESVPYNASVITLSEIDAHQAGSDYLRSKMASFMSQNALCTWTPLAAPVPASKTPIPETLADRIRALYHRIVDGAFR